MNTTELVEVLASRTGLPATAVSAVVRALSDIVGERILAGDGVELTGLGAWSRNWYQAQTVHSAEEGRWVHVEGGFQVRFWAATPLRRDLAELSKTVFDPRHQRAWRLARTLLRDLELYHPKSVPELGVTDDVELACRAGFGPLWDQVRTRYRADVPQALRDEVDHLSVEARNQWGRSGGVGQ